MNKEILQQVEAVLQPQVDDHFDCLIKDILAPRTPHEEAVALMLQLKPDLTSRQLADIAAEEFWRTEMENFRNHDFCKSCTQLPPETYCQKCGLPLNAGLFTTFDLIGDATAHRKFLLKTYLELKIHKVRTDLIAAIVMSLNMTKSNYPLNRLDVEALIKDAGTQKAGA